MRSGPFSLDRRQRVRIGRHSMIVRPLVPTYPESFLSPYGPFPRFHPHGLIPALFASRQLSPSFHIEISQSGRPAALLRKIVEGLPLNDRIVRMIATFGETCPFR
jgi:hypothetical protein